MSVDRRRGRWQVGFVILVLLVLHFYARERVWQAPGSPDFLILALLILAIRTQPGTAAVAGFVLGLMTDVLTPARFGAGALAHTVVGYLAAWGRAVFFPDNLLVNAGLFAGGVWVRTLIQLLASGAAPAELGRELAVWAPIQALTTAVAGVIVLVVFRNWLAIRVAE